MAEMWEKTWEKVNDNYYATTTCPTEVSVKEYTATDFWRQAWPKAGESLFYMQFLHPDVDWGEQKKRVERMCYHLATEWNQHIEDTPENRKWFRDWIEKFDDEVENQC